ncbi:MULTISPECIES: HAD family hydrolase [unclassified Rhizobium]|jgi:phosphoglycolate phosphatase-like HAD superfamily hydrolase|uniref:HAD family hydrolase n=1 Tax=unclassified Rhizobium TaxID=2613769 RepID=UPI00036F93CE|nr:MULTISPECIES: HAD family hydrolase [unclassified Rhizobium]MBD9448247.1 haloacid dehalogenase-like hydrolase [Rhizobium sp. RHZ01]MBD9454839.1 haloacid dehalogenase-like hydrolase [Rhizobium sp. RHZ02]NMN73019.1 Phosphoserine phosphatase [Rhizobium sp. 57MFTsu3.2]
MSRSVRFLLLFLLLPVSAFAQELPSWNDGKSKQAIVDFIKKVTTQGGADYVAPEDRIAVFDNDGTLWTEQPFYFQLGFILDRVKALAPQHPEWKEKEPFKSILAGDLKGIAKSGERGLVELVMETHAGLTTDDFRNIVIDWFATARHPKTGKPYNEMTFLPMRELLDYLRANGFKTFIVSGGGVEFMRPMTEKAYGIPPEQVVGSTITTQYALVGDIPVLNRLPKVDFVDDGPGKPVGINKFIGRRPILAAGNSDGDYEMLRWVMAGQGPHFAMIIHHTDADREYAYDRKSDFGKLDKALDEAESRNWLLVDMKADWKKIYAFDQ